MPKLRPYQSRLRDEINQAWAHLGPNGVVLAVSPTGTGKTVTFSDVILAEPGASCAIAHRKEIVSQIALSLARNGVRHRIIGTKKTQQACQRIQLKKLKRHFVDPNAKCAVAGIDTLLNISPTDLEYPWLSTVKLWVGDEGHHFLRTNKWGKGVVMFPNARGLLVTAETERADGKGLGRHADGFADAMVLGPTMREAINAGYLVDYRIAMPEGDVDIANVEVSKTTGDFNQHQLREAHHKSKTICGNVVKAYRKHSDGLRAVVFAVDVEEAVKIAKEFKADGVAAEALHGDSDEDWRDNVLSRFEAGEILVLVNVDLFGEGFDLPNIRTVIMVRHTESFNLYKQQWGRGARLDIPKEWADRWDDFTDDQRRALIAQSVKPHMMLIDMVGNVMRHGGPPDCRVKFSLDRRASRSSGESDAIPTRVCLNKNKNDTGLACAKRYERFYKKCPYCGHYPEPPSRTAPEFVDGDVLELDASVISAWLAKIAKVDAPTESAAYGEDVVARAIRNRHHARQQEQERLRRAMHWWSGLQAAQGVTDTGEQYRRFYHMFGCDVATAQTLGASEACALWLKICNYLALLGIDGTVSID